MSLIKLITFPIRLFGCYFTFKAPERTLIDGMCDSKDHVFARAKLVQTNFPNFILSVC